MSDHCFGKKCSLDIEATFGQISGNVSFDIQNLQRSFRKNPGFAKMLGFTLDLL